MLPTLYIVCFQHLVLIDPLVDSYIDLVNIDLGVTFETSNYIAVTNSKFIQNSFDLAKLLILIKFELF